MRLLFIPLALLLLSACATPKERVVYQRVEVPIFQPCAPKVSERPVYPTLITPVASDVFEQMRTLLVERDMRQAREVELEAAVAGCAGG